MRQVQTNGGESDDSIKACHGSFRSVRQIATLCSLESFKQNIHIHLIISETKNRLGVVLVDIISFRLMHLAFSDFQTDFLVNNSNTAMTGF